MTVVEQRIRAIITEFQAISTARLQDKWPSIYLELLIGSNVIGIYKCDPKTFIFSPDPADKGRLCSKLHHVALKSANCLHTCSSCGCVAAIAAIGGYVGSPDTDWLPDGYRQSATGQIEPLIETSFQCNFYIHQAKIRRGNAKTGLVDAKLIISMGQLQAQSSELPAETLTPIWNETLSVNCFTLMRSPYFVKEFPPILSVDLFDGTEKKVRTIVKVQVFYTFSV